MPTRTPHDLCPDCGGPLEAVVRAEEIIGRRALQSRPPARRPIADQVRETIARKEPHAFRDCIALVQTPSRRTPSRPR
jgi:hypothetical protein